MKGRPELPPLALTEAELNHLFDECNQNRFGGRLPRVWLEWMVPPGGLIASTRVLAARGPSIWMSPVLLCSHFADAIRIRQVLLHEMCHVEVGLGLDPGGTDLGLTVGHGARWQAAMMRLHDQDESWVLEDVRKMADQTGEEDELLARISAEQSRLDKALSWQEVQEILLKKFGKRTTKRWGIRAAEFIQRSPRVVEAWVRHQRQGDGKPR
jgi:hypothetical protein